MSYTVIVCYSLSNSWLAKTRQERDDYQATHVLPVMANYLADVEARFFDAEAFESEFSDFIVAQVEDLGVYSSLMEDLKRSPMHTEGYIDFRDFILGVEESLGPKPLTDNRVDQGEFV